MDILKRGLKLSSHFSASPAVALMAFSASSQSCGKSVFIGNGACNAAARCRNDLTSNMRKDPSFKYQTLGGNALPAHLQQSQRLKRCRAGTWLLGRLLCSEQTSTQVGLRRVLPTRASGVHLVHPFPSYPLSDPPRSISGQSVRTLHHLRASLQGP
eukprot:2088649-Amphidinium_carterae.1